MKRAEKGEGGLRCGQAGVELEVQVLGMWFAYVFAVDVVGVAMSRCCSVEYDVG